MRCNPINSYPTDAEKQQMQHDFIDEPEFEFKEDKKTMVSKAAANSWAFLKRGSAQWKSDSVNWKNGQRTPRNGQRKKESNEEGTERRQKRSLGNWSRWLKGRESSRNGRLGEPKLSMMITRT